MSLIIWSHRLKNKKCSSTLDIIKSTILDFLTLYSWGSSHFPSPNSHLSGHSRWLFWLGTPNFQLTSTRTDTVLNSTVYYLIIINHLFFVWSSFNRMIDLRKGRPYLLLQCLHITGTQMPGKLSSQIRTLYACENKLALVDWISPSVCLVMNKHRSSASLNLPKCKFSGFGVMKEPHTRIPVRNFVSKHLTPMTLSLFLELKG